MDQKRLILLIIDDSLGDARFLLSLLTQALGDSFDALHVESAADARHEMTQGRFDCVFLDYLLEGDSGLEVIRAIRAAGDDTPIIAVSGNGSEEVAVEALSLGAQDYMVKAGLTPAGVKRSLTNAIEKVRFKRLLAEQRRDLEDFAHVAAHDLREPLAGVILFVEWLQDRFADQADDQARGVFTRVLDGADNMSRLLDALLEYAEVGRSQQPLEAVGLAEVVDAATANLQRRIQQTGAVIDADGLPTVLGDRFGLVQLLQNLLANAIKFSGDATPVIRIGARPEQGRWLVSVADNGIGVAPEDHDKIFAPFRRLHQKSEYEGSGIGLATCKRIIAQHEGEIWVESELGVGTTFWFTLPTVDAAAAASNNEQQAEAHYALS
ncbi:Phytochrome-like protein cph1 [Posidoniimonas corsicana]|uniref:histidine kinase n=1 Tax=Posidoniimonas corsicana TaxID=1938618 RepID=A0A5C5VGH2_9BACT|nr:hybrid sensor histidine kinase/response regulator [Posidoniimonas corsicana]TWT36999.1 Phytochrome-like protein cph1 [Posidoniimonas corsicana]